MTATKTIYLVTYSDYDIYSIEGAYERREDAEAHVALSDEIDPGSDLLGIDEIELTDGPPRIVHSAVYSGGECLPGNRIVGFVAPAYFRPSAPEVRAPAHAVAWGYSPEEAMEALNTVLLENGVS